MAQQRRSRCSHTVSFVCVCSVWVPCVNLPSGGGSSAGSSPLCGSPVGWVPPPDVSPIPVASVPRLASRSCSRSRSSFSDTGGGARRDVYGRMYACVYAWRRRADRCSHSVFFVYRGGPRVNPTNVCMFLYVRMYVCISERIHTYIQKHTYVRRINPRSPPGLTRGELKRRKYQVKARYQIRANALLGVLTQCLFRIQGGTSTRRVLTYACMHVCTAQTRR